MASNVRSSRLRAGSSAGEAVMLMHRPNVDTNLSWLMFDWICNWCSWSTSFILESLTLSELWYRISVGCIYCTCLSGLPVTTGFCELPGALKIFQSSFRASSRIKVVLAKCQEQYGEGHFQEMFTCSCGDFHRSRRVSRFGSTGTKNPISWTGKQHVDLLGIQTMSQGIHTSFFWQDVKVLWTMSCDVFCSNGVQTWQIPNQTALTRSIEEDELVKLHNLHWLVLGNLDPFTMDNREPFGATTRFY